MKNIRINRITYENFKGIKSFVLDLNGKDANVSARNAIGKTTLFDGFYWLLFGKDSAENSKFDVKPFDENGNEILGKEPIVEAELAIDHKTVTLRRELKEVWSTIKGRLEKERKSDKTKYYIDGVPVKTQKEYQEFIASIVDENIFKLLTNPFAFNGLHWSDRRDILMSLVEDVSIDDVIEANDELEGLKEILEGRSPEDQKAIVKSKMKDIKKDIDGLTVRFDEAERAIPDTAGLDESALNAQLKSKTAEYDKLQTEAAEIKNGGAIAKFQQQIDGIKHKINEGKLQFSQSNQLAVSSFVDDLEWTKSKLRAANDNAEDYKYNIQRLEKHISNIKNEKANLLDQYHRENAVTFDEHRTTCAMCGQDLPEDQISSMKNTFNKDKSEKVAKILEDGKTKATEIQIAEKQLSDMKEELVCIEKEKEKYQGLANNLEAEIEKVRAGNQKYEDSDEYQEYVQQGLDLQEKITTEQESKRTLLEDIAENQIELTKAIDEIKQSLSLIDLAKRQNDRLTELKSLHKKMVDNYNSLQGQEFMLDEFTRSRVQLLEEQINQQFKYAKFKLFQLQKNGGIDEVCEATFNGIAYTNNLNNAARINVGLDIINTLSNHYQVSAPIFVDNAESVNELIETQAQVVSLVVSLAPKLLVKTFQSY